MTLHPDLKLPSAGELAALTPEQIAAGLNGEDGTGLSGTLGARLGIRYLAVSPTRIEATMPVEGNRQPAGRLHGGASLALAEELASIGSWLNLDPARQVAVGVDVNATHVRGVTGGEVRAEATLAYKGRTVMVWEIRVHDGRGRVTSMARCTCNVVSSPG